MAAIFAPHANLVAKLTLLAAATGALGGIGWWWAWPRTDYVRHTNWTVEQPVPFSHEHHVSGLGLDCRFCHTTVETEANAGMPPTQTCMTCHSQIWTNAGILAPVRDSLANDTPLVWHRINDVPDYVYFNHAIHIAKGIGCASCHGDVANMPLMQKAKTLTMGFCLDCHRDPAPRLRPKDAIFNTEWQRAKDTPSPAALMAFYHVGDRKLTDCSICHR
ncbi:MAG TPA: cytochrome c3 family protein [Rhizomicrobium sp.]|nr:cytochrome c3 family protein [Rhizomicrobium sp.]